LYEKNIKGAAEDFYIYVHNSVPDLFTKKSGYNVCFSYWETNKIPLYWLDTINSADEMWTTSKWAKEVFINSGVTIPVYDFKLGVNPLHYSPPAKPRWLAKDKFIFLSIGSPSTRKNSQMSVDAFVKLFGNNERFEMIYKSNGPPDARLKDNITNVKTFLTDHPRIKVIDWQVNQEDLASIYDQADCLVYPTSGEGWGLLPFQAIAKGIPTICTNATACTEFAELSVPLDFKWGTKNMFGIYEGCGDWAEPDFDDLCDKMLYIVNNYDEISKKTFDGAQFINQNLTWEHVGQEYVNRLCQISK
jgi:glycosyltransferase involved in cell wall biosynthesis